LRAGLEHLVVKKPGMVKQASDRNQGRESLDRSLRLSRSPPSLAKSLGRQGSNLSPSPTLKLERRGTDVLLDRIAGFGRQQEALGKLRQLKDAELSVDSQDSQGQSTSQGPFPLHDLRRENSALVLDDETLLIRIPFNLERLYVQHITQIEQAEMEYKN